MAIGAWTIDAMMAMMGGGDDEENADLFAQAGIPMAPMSQMADEQLRPNSQLSGVVTFEVPLDVMAATFHLDGDTTPIDVDVSLGPDGQEPAAHDHEE